MISFDRKIYKITVEGVDYICKGGRKIVNGQSMYMFFRSPGVETDVILCPDPEAEGYELYSSLMRMNNVQDGTIQAEKAYKYLTFVAEQNESSVSMTFDNQLNIEYSLNGGSWTEYTSGTALSLANKGDFVSFRCTNDVTVSTSFRVTISGRVSAHGDVTSLVNGVGGDCALKDSRFKQMFQGCTGLTSAPELPSITLATSCYYQMFNGCTSLTTAPELPATTLATGCYQMMFYGCTSLTQAPALPANTLAPYCYNTMFNGCTSLTTAPELPATTLASSCYAGMFENCTSLITTPDLPATTLASSCYDWMFAGCTNLASTGDLSNVTSVGTRQFYHCSNPNLTLEFSDKLKSMDENCLTGVTGRIKFNRLPTSNDDVIKNEYDSDLVESDNYYTLEVDIDSIPTGFSILRFLDTGERYNNKTNHYMNYTVYTDYEPFKNIMYGFADGLTLVTVRHLDGSSW